MRSRDQLSSILRNQHEKRSQGTLTFSPVALRVGHHQTDLAFLQGLRVFALRWQNEDQSRSLYIHFARQAPQPVLRTKTSCRQRIENLQTLAERSEIRRGHSRVPEPIDHSIDLFPVTFRVGIQMVLVQAFPEVPVHERIGFTGIQRSEYIMRTQRLER